MIGNTFCAERGLGHWKLDESRKAAEGRNTDSSELCAQCCVKVLIYSRPKLIINSAEELGFSREGTLISASAVPHHENAVLLNVQQPASPETDVTVIQ